jgi:large subunit ribosomal protein L9
MEVILKQDIEKLGFKDEIVKVKPGYGRNFLIPKGYAILASETNKKVLAETLKQRSFKEAKIKDDAEKVVKALAETTIQVAAKAGEKGKIFGSVTNVQLADAIKALGHEVDRKMISIHGSVKELGTYEAEIRLHREISTKISFEVING